ncbi:cation diffusion facilitator family transporter [Mycolicibacterium fortuitum subsp. acetamidolyticum]|uniref:Cation diffusion facilitator family transporter n=1 Tax=Mycolicibacterium fortuitum subsp. acetamidolyticum TaxID=144550 RepID=A0A100WW54_MYCFO|nr:hypothetical protein EB73_29145 [Mycobacterium sp. SWH-M3]OKH70883.1 hypothetical protein EB72_25150 [Mycobacterium sp. SWH-M1]RWA23339.1 hypothetical protein MBRU_00540 [Mycolicibacterium brumae DSM 44177]GAT05467.1 cation diffusion facilitator family transporter [Mycolicibacterium fortuitum subsp. acetamidolyticum]
MGAGHDHSHGGDTRVSRMLIAAGILTTFFVIELITALMINSIALLADAGHMLTDLVAMFMGLTAVLLARRGSASPARTYGWHRAEVFTAVANAVLLMGVAAFILYEAFERLGGAPEVPGVPLIVVALAGLIANVVVVLLLRGDSEKSLAVKGAYMEVVADTVGSIGVLIAGIVTVTTGWPYADVVVAVFVALWVLPRAVALARAALRILSESSPTHIDVDELRRALRDVPGVSPVSLYRNRPRAEQRCADLLADPAHQDVRAHADTLAARLGSYVPGDAADRELERLGLPPQSNAAALLLYLAGPYRQRGDWLDNAATKGHDTAAAATTALFRRHPGPTPAQLHTALTEAGLSEGAALRYVETHLQLRRFGDVVVRWNDQSVANMCEAVLHALGKPSTAATIYAHLDSTDTSASYVREALSDDYRFTRSSRTLWALRAWNIPEYHGIAAALGSYLDAQGGHADVETILNDFAARYPDVSPKSIMRYLDSLEFIVDLGVARRRTTGDNIPPVGPLNAVRGVFRNGDNEIRCVRTCTDDLLRGSGQAIHTAVAQALGVTPGEHRTLHGPHGDVRVRWRMASSSGADLSSLRAYAHAIGARPGDTLVLAFGTDAGTVEVRRVDAGPGTTRRLEQILGRTVADRDAELAASLDCAPEEITTVLARRGDHAVLGDLVDGITAVASPDGETASQPWP